MKTKMLVLILVLPAAFLIRASEIDRLACDSVRAVHGARYDKIKREAKEFVSDADPAHLANQNLLKRALPRLQTLTKKYQQLINHLPDQGQVEMRKILVQEYFTKAQKMLNSVGVSNVGLLRSIPCSTLGGCKVETTVALNGLHSIPWNPSLELEVRHEISRNAISIPEEEVSRFLGFSKVNLLSGTSDIGSAFDAKVASAQIELVEAQAYGSRDSLKKATTLNDARFYQRVATQSRRQFIDAELTSEQRLACGVVPSAGNADSIRVASHVRSFESAVGATMQVHSLGGTEQR